MDIIGGEILNFVGGSIRWFFGTIYSILFNKKRFTFNEYLYGENIKNNDYEKLEHSLANKVAAFIFFFVIIVLISFL